LSARVSVITVTVTDINKVNSVIDKIKNQVPKVNVFKSQEAVSRLAPLMNSISWISYVLFAVTGVACVFGIGNVMLTGIFERTREIGILKALGAKSSDVAKMIFYESSIIGAVGGFLGCLISASLLVRGLVIPMTSAAELPILLFPETLVYGLISSVVISVLAAVYPVWRAVHVRPNEVLKFG